MKLTKTRTANAHCTRLAPQVTVDAQAYTSLPVHEQTRLRCLAAALSAHRAVLAACSAARVHRLWVLSARGEEDIELALAGGTAPPNAQVPPGWRYHKMKLPPGDLVSVSAAVSAEEGATSVRATSPARTVVDLARLHGFVRGLVAADSYLARGYERAALEAVAGRLKGTRGIGRPARSLRPRSASRSRRTSRSPAACSSTAGWRSATALSRRPGSGPSAWTCSSMAGWYSRWTAPPNTTGRPTAARLKTSSAPSATARSTCKTRASWFAG